MDRTPTLGDYLTVGEVVEIHGVHRHTVYNWIANGDIVTTKLGRTILINRESLMRMLAGDRRPCLECGGLFTTRIASKKYCSPRCRSRHNVRLFRERKRLAADKLGK